MVPAEKQIKITKVSQVKWTNRIPPPRPQVPPPFNSAEMDQMLQSLRDVGQLCPAMSLRAPHNQLFIPKTIEVNNNNIDVNDGDTIRFDLFLVNVDNVHHTEYLEYSLEDLQRIAADISLNYSDFDTAHIEKMTRTQALCELWYRFRAYRITAFNFKAVCRTSMQHPSLSLIKNMLS